MQLKLDIKKIILEKLANYDISNNNLIFLYELLNNYISDLDFKAELIDINTIFYKADDTLIKLIFGNNIFECSYLGDDIIIKIIYSKKEKVLKIYEIKKEQELILYELLNDIGRCISYSKNDNNTIVKDNSSSQKLIVKLSENEVDPLKREYCFTCSGLFYFDACDSYDEVLKKIKILKEQDKSVLVTYLDNDKKYKIL